MFQTAKPASSSLRPAESAAPPTESPAARSVANSLRPIASPLSHSNGNGERTGSYVDQAHQRPWTRSLFAKIGVVVGVIALSAYGVSRWNAGEHEVLPEVTATAVRAELPITVIERGELESSKTVEVRCEVEGEQIKIVDLTPEGTRVREGDIVIRFDTDKLGRSIAEQEVKSRTADAKSKAAEEDLEVARNQAASENAKAKLALKLAQIDLRKYVEGDFPQEKREIEGEVLIAEEELKRAHDRLQYSERMRRKGYLSTGEVEAEKFAETKSQNTLNLAREKLRVLERFTRERTEAELSANSEEAAREMERCTRSQNSTIAKADSDYRVAVATAAIEKAQLDRLKQQLERCTVKAPRDGILVYSKDRPWDQTARVQVGGIVHFQQRLFSLPDLNELQVRVRIHESAVKKLQEGQTTEIRVDAFPNRVLSGIVEKVATLADARGFWDQRGVKEYETMVRLTNVPEDGGLKPGMTAEVKILVNRLSDVLVVPVQAVAEHAGSHVLFVIADDTLERRTVVVGENNDQFIQITSGLSVGDRVALDARARVEAAADTEKKHPEDATNKPVDSKQQANRAVTAPGQPAVRGAFGG
ncbi:MAG: efflux RND transporter periplasmic adaptor subunit [Planctomycetales bacterium]|nr:efflux RND transporter periplasmic adaptor subunit [Planctomycetales bacterium]